MAMLHDKTGVKIAPVDLLSAHIYQEINGEYRCTIECTPDTKLEAEQIIELKDQNGSLQLFRLMQPIKELNIVRADGWHITQDLAYDMIINRAWLAQTGAQAWPELLKAGMVEKRFSGTSDITITAPLRIVRRSVLAAAIGKQDNSFVNRFGGELERNNYIVNAKKRLGADRGYNVRFGRDLLGIVIDTDDSEIINKVVPTVLNASNASVLLPEVSISSPLISQTATPHTVHVHYGDIKVGEENEDGTVPYPTLESAFAEARARVAKMWKDGADKPRITIDVDFIALRQTEEYKDLADLEEIQLGDTITVMLDDLTVRERLVAYEWDVLNEQYTRTVLGSPYKSQYSTLSSFVEAASSEMESKVEGRVFPAMTEALAELSAVGAQMAGLYTTKIYNADGSYVVYVHDKPELENSLKIEYYPEPGVRMYTRSGWNGGNPAWSSGEVDGSMIIEQLIVNRIDAKWINLSGGETLDSFLSKANKTFTVLPTTPYGKDDLWLKQAWTDKDIPADWTGDTVSAWNINSEHLVAGGVWVCINPRETGDFNWSDWRLIALDQTLSVITETKLTDFGMTVSRVETDVEKNMSEITDIQANLIQLGMQIDERLLISTWNSERLNFTKWIGDVPEGQNLASLVSGAQSTADGAKASADKAQQDFAAYLLQAGRFFTDIPVPPYKKGDMWLKPSWSDANLPSTWTGDTVIPWGLNTDHLMAGGSWVCINPRTTGAFDWRDWSVVAQDSTVANLTYSELSSVALKLIAVQSTTEQSFTEIMAGMATFAILSKLKDPDYTSINGSNINTGVIKAINGASWIDLLVGSFSFANGKFTYDPVNGVKLGGWSMENDGLYIEATRTVGPYTDADLTAIQEYIIGTRTLSDSEKYRLDAYDDGMLTILDRTVAKYIQDGLKGSGGKQTYTYRISISSLDPRQFIKIERKDLNSTDWSLWTYVGPSLIKTPAISASNADLGEVMISGSVHVVGKAGLTQTITMPDGKNLTFTNGILTDYA